MSQTETREHKIKCDYGLPDYRKDYKNSVKEPEDDETYNNVLIDWLMANQRAIRNFGYIFVLPKRMGRIEIRKTKGEVKIGKDGQVINNLAVNWKATRKLWSENEEAKEKKIKIRYTNEHSNGYIFRPRYMKNTANYKNKSIYRMSINRQLSRGTYSAIVSGKLDAFLLKPE